MSTVWFMLASWALGIALGWFIRGAITPAQEQSE